MIEIGASDAMKTARLFKNGRSQAVRLPKEFRFDGDEVFVKRVGDGVLLLPRRAGWALWREALDAFGEVTLERHQPPMPHREPLEP
jgi:antitoxin VapB